MNNILKVLLFFIIIITFIGCEETIDDMQLPYVEQMVVRCTLEDGMPVKMTITKTLPPLEELTFDKIQINDVTGYIECDGIRYPIQYSDGFNYKVNDLIPEIGKEYSLVLNWRDKQAHAKTRIPDRITIDTAYKILTKKNVYGLYYTWNIIYYVEFSPNQNSVYTALNTQSYNEQDTVNIYSNVAKRSMDTNSYGRIVIPFFIYEWVYDTSLYSQVNEYNAAVEAYDTPFYDYFLTRYKGDSPTDIFSTTGQGNVHWNIQGDGIGLFLGFSSTKKHITL